MVFHSGDQVRVGTRVKDLVEAAESAKGISEEPASHHTAAVHGTGTNDVGNKEMCTTWRSVAEMALSRGARRPEMDEASCAQQPYTCAESHLWSCLDDYHRL